MSVNNQHFELQEAQQRKIDYFCEITNDNNISQAEHYLNKANWNEELAVQYFFSRQSQHFHQNNNIDNNRNNNKNNNMKDNNLKRHASAKMNNNNINNNYNFNYSNNLNPNIDKNKNNYVRRINNIESKYIELNINNLINEKEKGSQYIHDKTLLHIKNNLKNVETNFKTFIQKLGNNAGVILIFKDDNLPRLKEQINQINEIKEIVQNYVIFPISKDSEQGMDISLTLFCISFPCYIFCKNKNENEIYITDKMEGGFEKSFFENCLKKIIPKPNPNKVQESINSKSKIIPKPQTNIKKKDNEQIFQNVFSEFKGNNNNNKKKENIGDKFQNMKNPNKNKIDNNNNNNYNKNINKNQINHNNKEKILGNKYDINSIDNYINYGNNNNFGNDFNKKENNFDNNYDINRIDNNIKYEKNVGNDFGLINEIDINNNNKENNKANNKNEFRYSNYGDFFLGDSMEIPNLFGAYNNIANNNPNFINNNPNNNMNIENIDIYENKKEEPKNIIENKNDNNNNIDENDNMLRDSIYNLSYGQILAKREQEMKKLEKMQEEKEKKQAEEKKKILEEQKKIKKYEQEAEIAKMILGSEPDDNNPDTCHIKFRLPDGEKMKERKFLKTDKISILYDYVKSIGREIFMEPDATDFDILYVGFPPKNLENCKNNTLEEEGLYPNSILQISEK